MKAKLFAVMALASVALISCQNDDYEFENNRPAKPGDEIVFGGTMEYKSTRTDVTRTVYGDKGSTGTEIKWYEGDKVRIYCAQANLGENGGDQKYCDYQVTDYITAPGGNNSNPIDGKYETNHSTGLRTPDGSTGLCWGTGAHDFYALYPSPAMLNKNGEDNVVVNSLKIEGKTVTAYLPNLQAPSAFVAPTTDAESKNKHYTIHPAMRYAYMVASATGKQRTDNNVSLTFNPIITAVEMTIVNGGNATIEGVQMVSLSSENTICGEFSVEDVSVDVKDMTIKHSSSGDSYNIVSVPVAETGKTIDLNPGDTLTFTAFLALNADLNKITTTIVYANGVATRKATLTGNNGVNIVQAKKKNFITKLDANFSNAVSSVDLEHWMASISNTTSDGTTARTLASLSIPAAGGAASGHTTDWVTNETYLEQKLTIEDLWDQGIRCFEFTVDINTGSSLGDSYIYNNTINTGLKLSEAVEKVQNKLLDNPTEFAMVIITYQQNGGWDLRDQEDLKQGNVTYERNPTQFMKQLNSYWTSVSKDPAWETKKVDYEGATENEKYIQTGTALYSPGMTIRESRGKLFCIARPTSDFEDSYINLNTSKITFSSDYKIGTVSYNDMPTFTNSNNIVVINGWGAMKDKWNKRGYTSCGFFRGNGNNAWDDLTNSQKKQLGYNDNNPGHPFEVSNNLEDGMGSLPDNYMTNIELNPDFTYTTNASFNAWIQEWARVSNSNTAFNATYTINNTQYSRRFKWADTKNEKISNITTTLEMSLDDQDGKILYINSLCGYFISSDIENSYLPNSLTNMSHKAPNIAGYIKYSGLSGASNKAGMSGDISSFAQWVNNQFYNYLLTKELGGKSTGIIMMDRVSNDATANPAGYYIPRIILANNPFAEGAIADPASVPVLDEIFEPNTDMPTSPKSQENKISVSWD